MRFEARIIVDPHLQQFPPFLVASSVVAKNVVAQGIRDA